MKNLKSKLVLKNRILFYFSFLLVTCFILNCKNTKGDLKPIFPIAKFAFNVEDDGVVQFNNLSENSETYSWDFGDGAASTEVSPKHKFKKNATFNVKLVASNSIDLDSVKTTVEIKSVLKKDNVFICGDNGTCSLLNAKTGELVWQYKNNPYIISSPTYSNNTLYFATSEDFNTNKIIAIDYETGLKKWEFITSAINLSSPLVVENKLFYLSFGKLFCIDANSGKLLWEVSSIGFYDSSPTYHEGKIYFVSNNGLEIFDATNGIKIKNARIDQNNTIMEIKKTNGYGTYHSSPAVYNQVCYYIYQNSLIAFDLKTNTSKTLTFNNKNFTNTSSPTIYNDALFVKDDEGLYVIKLPEFTVKTQIIQKLIDYQGTSPLAIENYTLYSQGNQFYCLDFKTLNPIWVIEENIFSSSNYFDSLVYVATNKNLIAIEIKTGKIVWKYSLNSSILGHLPSPLIITKEGIAYHTSISGARQ